MEILSPIKNLENAKIAILNGADALYLASPSFGARASASMNLNSIKKIIILANSYNVKTFITFNTIVFDDELNNFFYELDCIYTYGATGIIIQDFSFINIIKKLYDDLEVHCSTQMHIHNQNAINIVKNFGSNRVVVPREMNFEKIKKIKDNINIDIEAFVHGALCVCYSGQCYDSTLLDQKSANRGRCSQYCRMPQNIINIRTNKVVSKCLYPLNLKDLNNINNLDKYKKAGVDSLKIEGRLKGIDYVGLTTKSYKNKLNNKDISLSLNEVYNRTFTSGRINNINGNELVNLHRPNNSGIKIGVILNITKNNNSNLKYYKYLFILKLYDDFKLYKGDNLRFIFNNEEKGQVVEKVEYINKNKYLLYSNEKIINKSIVYKTKNQKLIDEYTLNIEKVDVLKQNININLYITKNNINYKIYIDNNVYDFKSDISFENAISVDLKKDDIINVLKKTKNTNYKIIVNELFLDDNLFAPIKHIKLLRDEIIKSFESINTKKEFRPSKYNMFLDYINTLENNKDLNTAIKQKPKNYYISLKTIEHLNYFLNLEYNDKLKNIILLLDYTLARDIVKDSEPLTNLKNKYEVYLTLPKVIYDDEQSDILKVIKYFDNLCISEIGSLKYINLVNKKLITNFTFNTTNKLNTKLLNDLNVDKQILSIELNNKKINDLANNSTIVNIYGKIPIMLMDYCPINLKKTDLCGDCRRCRTNNYALKDKLNRVFNLLYEGNNRIGLYSNKTLSLFDNLNKINKVNNYFLNLTLENNKDIDNIMKSINDNKNYIKNSFDGNFFKNIL